MFSRAIWATLVPGVLLAFDIDVPGDVPTPSAALAVSLPGDTILVHPGVYQDRLITPPHDVVLISEFILTGDSGAIDGTIIDASSYADYDTASVITFDSLNTRSTFIGGFTLMGGHGKRGSSDPSHRWGGALFSRGGSPTVHACRLTRNYADYFTAMELDYGSPLISHCEIDSNCAMIGLAVFNGTLTEEPVIFEWNDVHNNYLCPEWNGYLEANCVGVQWGRLIFRFNHLHDQQGVNCLGLDLYESHGEVYGNVFERLSSPFSITLVISSTQFGNVYRDNIFRDIWLADGWCVSISHPGPLNPYRSIIERNWFESVTSVLGPSCLWMTEVNAEIRENVFFNCIGGVGTVQFAQNMNWGCNAVFERNHFFYNQATYVESNGSAFNAIGIGPPCTFSNNWFEGNEGWTVSFDTTILPQPDLSNNYWGDPSGPFHPTENPGGLGDSVPANVHVTPWLTAPPGMNTDVLERLRLNPEDWTVEQAFPNPFNASTSLRITSSKPQPFEVDAYNILGRRIARVWQGIVPKDTPTLVRWHAASDQGQSLASGIYFLLATPKGPGAGAPKSAKVVLLK